MTQFIAHKKIIDGDDTGPALNKPKYAQLLDGVAQEARRNLELLSLQESIPGDTLSQIDNFLLAFREM